LRTPNLFVVGAPKCGTTSMHNYLHQHPDVFMSSRKEPHYFGSDLKAPHPYFIRDWKEYIALFSGATEQSFIGESSTWYMLSRRDAQEIHGFCPDARIIMMLRNPVDQMYALHSQRLYICNEDIVDFEETLLAEEDRRAGRRIPRDVNVVEGLYYREVATYSPQVERYLRLFPSKNVHVILFDDLQADSPRTFRRVCQFLGIDDGFVPNLQTHNANKLVRHPRIYRWAKRPHPLLRSIVAFTIPRVAASHIRKSIVHRNVVIGRRPTMSEGLRRSLMAEFAPEVQRLERLIGRDLSNWTDKG